MLSKLYRFNHIKIIIDNNDVHKDFISTRVEILEALTANLDTIVYFNSLYFTLTNMKICVFEGGVSLRKGCILSV